MKNKKIFFIAILIGFITPAFTLAATCPLPEEVSYQCDTHCHWKAEGYTGRTAKETQEGESATDFKNVYWIAREGIEPKPGISGITICSYEDENGEPIELFNSKWNSVSYPTTNSWQDRVLGNSRARFCDDSVEGCEF